MLYTFQILLPINCQKCGRQTRFMKLIQKYISRQALIPLILSLATLTLLALLTQSLSTLDLIVENRQSAGTFLYITFLALPQLFAIILPFAVFMAALFTLNRLNVDSEMVVTKSSGFSPWQIASPVLRIGTAAMIVHLILNLYLQPYAFRKMRKALLDVRSDVASRLVKAGEFSTPTPGLTMYASTVTASGKMTDVFIYDQRSAEAPITYSAKTGQLQSANDRSSFTLYNGNVHYIKEDGTMEITDFESNTYDLSDIMSVDTTLHLKTSDRYLHELFFLDPNDFAYLRWIHEYTAEGHSRLATPLYNLALVFLAVCFLVRGEHRKMGYGKRIFTVMALGFGLRIIGFSLTDAAEGDPNLNIYQYLVPLLTCLWCALYLSRRRRARTFVRRPQFLKRRQTAGTA